MALSNHPVITLLTDLWLTGNISAMVGGDGGDLAASWQGWSLF
jgi:hypothetical protein